MKDSIIGNLELMRKIAKNKSQLAVLEHLYNNHYGVRLHKAREQDAALQLAEKYPKYFTAKLERQSYSQPYVDFNYNAQGKII